MKYIVIYSYDINVEAKDEKEAKEKAKTIWNEIAPRTDEMNVEVEIDE